MTRIRVSWARYFSTSRVALLDSGRVRTHGTSPSAPPHQGQFAAASAKLVDSHVPSLSSLSTPRSQTLAEKRKRRTGGINANVHAFISGASAKVGVASTPVHARSAQHPHDTAASPLAPVPDAMLDVPLGKAGTGAVSSHSSSFAQPARTREADRQPRTSKASHATESRSSRRSTPASSTTTLLAALRESLDHARGTRSPRPAPHATNRSHGDAPSGAAHTPACQGPSKAQKEPLEGPTITPSALPDARPPVAPQPTTKPVTGVFLEHLSRSITQRQIDWEAISRCHPELRQMPLYGERARWTACYCRHHAATPIAVFEEGQSRVEAIPDTPRESAASLPVFICTAPTGAGKSFMVCLCFLDAHWRALADVVASAAAHHRTTLHETQATPPASAHKTDEDVDALPLNDVAAFARRLKARSRVCIVVAQPTRLACLELAKYTASVFDTATETDRRGVGGRVGYAVGGETAFSEQTEIVYATPGYILNALQHGNAAGATTPGASRLCPTTLIIDEAHCRDVETDLLLTFVRVHRDPVHFDSVLPNSAWRQLRQVVVMSATLNTAAMIRYFDVAPVIWLLTSAQQRVLANALGASTHNNSTTTTPQGPQGKLSVLVAASDMPDDTQPVHTPSQPVLKPCRLDAKVMAALTGVAGAGPYPVERYFLEDLAQPQAGPRGVTDNTRAAASSVTGALPLSPIAARGGLQSSSILFPWLATQTSARAEDERTRRAPHRGSGRDKPQSGRRCPRTGVEGALLLSQDGLALLHHLQSTFSARFLAGSALARRPNGIDRGLSQLSVQLYGPQANRIAELVLQLLQALRIGREERQRSDAHCAEAGTEAGDLSLEAAHVPDTILLFLPGFAEIQLVLQALERRCGHTFQSASGPPRGDGDGAPSSSSSSPSSSSSSQARETVTEPVTVLQYGKETFSVPVLHAAAVGSPQAWLHATSDTRHAPQQRLVLATNVAESSLTIPGVRVVLDACLTRRFVADPITGTTVKATTLANAGSLQQRCGRAGRTGPGVVIHLAPRALFHSEETNQFSSSFTSFEPLSESLTAVALRVKSLLAGSPAASSSSSQTSPRLGVPVSTILLSMPCPPSRLELEAAYQSLVDMDLLLPAPSPSSSSSSSHSTSPCGDAEPQPQTRREAGAAMPAGPHRMDHSALSPKGRLVALLPIPIESALLIYHAFAFSCAEEAVLVACAMTVPSLFTTPRLATDAAGVNQNGPDVMMTTTREAMARTRHNRKSGGRSADAARATEAVEAITFSPLEQYTQHLLVQRQLAGAVSSGEEDTASRSAAQSSAMENLSEPLVLRALMREWYASPSSLHLMRLQSKYRLNRSAVRSVDLAIAQCCQRLLHCLHTASDGPPETPTAADTEDDAHAYFMLSASSATTKRDSGLPTLVDSLWPPRYRERLAHSLYRLRQAALARATHRLSPSPSPHEGLPQWYGAERELVRLMETTFRGGGGTEGVRHGNRGRGGNGGGGVVLHPCLDDPRAATDSHGHGQRSGASPPAILRGSAESRGRTLAVDLPQYTHRARLFAAQKDSAQSTLCFGSPEDRLRAAFVAAFSRHTLHGTDGGYRRHHRRLTRNMAVLGSTDAACRPKDTDAVDVDSDAADANVASFTLDVRPLSGLSSSFSRPPASRAASRTTSADKHGGDVQPIAFTPHALLEALRAFLGKQRVAQAELFRDGRTAVVRFTRCEGAMSSSSAGTSRSAESPSKVRVARPLVRLAPFGYSLLLAAQGVLQRVPADLSRLQLTDEATASHERERGRKTKAGEEEATRGHKHSQQPQQQQQRGTQDREAVNAHKSAASVHQDRSAMPSAAPQFDTHESPSKVRWHDHIYGTQRVLHRADVEALGLGAWFPTPPSSPSSSRAEVTRYPETNRSHDDATDAFVETDQTEPTNSDRDVQHAAAVWSVLSPLNITRGIYWKVYLPSAAAWWWRRRRAAETGTSSHGQRSSSPSRDVSLPPSYCPLCHTTCVGGAQVVASHCRGQAHLQHLFFAVQHHMHAAQLASLVTSTADMGTHTAEEEEEECAPSPSSSRHTATTTPEAGVRMPSEQALFLPSLSSQTAPEAAPPLPLELYACRLAPLSFLNALQWEASSAVVPLAIAGALVSSSSSSSSPAASWSSSSSSSSPMAAVESAVLTAHHVWVIPPVTPPRDAARKPISTASAALADTRHAGEIAASEAAPVLSTGGLLTLAGFVTASTKRSPAFFLFNTSHTHVFAVQLRGHGMWSFMANPLPVRELGALAYMMGGGAWPGVMHLLPSSSSSTMSSSSSSNASHISSSSSPSVREDLHWCVPDVSLACPQCTYYAPTSPSEATVLAVILLVLHDYSQAQRRMVGLADFVERVVAKLDMDSVHTSSAPSSHGVARLARVFAQRQADEVRLRERAEGAHEASPDGQERAGQRLLAGDSLVSVLQSVGCQFVMPPHGLSAAQRQNSMSDSAVGTPALFSSRALAVQGASLEMQFTVPTALPSFFPTRALSSLTQQFYETRSGAAMGVGARRRATSEQSHAAPASASSSQRSPSSLRF